MTSSLKHSGDCRARGKRGGGAPPAGDAPPSFICELPLLGDFFVSQHGQLKAQMPLIDWLNGTLNK